MSKGLRLPFIITIVNSIVLLAACGDSRTINPNYNPKGAAGNLSVSEQPAQDKNNNIEKFPVGFNSTATWTAMTDYMNNTPGTMIIGGVVVPSSSSESGFYFDPDTTAYSTGGAPEWITTIDQIKADPKKFATTKADGAFPIGFWYVWVQVDEINPGSSH